MLFKMKLSPLTGFATLLLGAVVVFTSCKKESLPYKYESQQLNLPATAYNYRSPQLPAHMASVSAKLSQKVTDHGATLGRVLFYDTKLSLNNKVACASCHFQENAFSDVSKFSTGFDGLKTSRNASAIVNPIESGAFFWDGRENDLKSMVLKPIENHIEMGLDNFEAMEKKISSSDYYAPLFEQAFGDKTVTTDRIADAMQQFLNSMVSGNSKVDASKPTGWGAGDPLVFNGEELAGMNLFFGKAGCANCHNTIGAFDFNGGAAQARFEDIGLEEVYTTDLGMGERQPGMEGMFKVPQLRNVALTAPYMHDGRFATLKDVVNHYNEGIQESKNLGWALRGGDGKAIRLNLSEGEKDQLVAFLGAFNDNTFTSDPKFSNPFK
jgi:cytochrome c peroxidase